jgi:hypothetical protein
LCRDNAGDTDLACNTHARTVHQKESCEVLVLGQLHLVVACS